MYLGQGRIGSCVVRNELCMKLILRASCTDANTIAKSNGHVAVRACKSSSASASVGALKFVKFYGPHTPIPTLVLLPCQARKRAAKQRLQVRFPDRICLNGSFETSAGMLCTVDAGKHMFALTAQLRVFEKLLHGSFRMPLHGCCTDVPLVCCPFMVLRIHDLRRHGFQSSAAFWMSACINERVTAFMLRQPLF